ncbi:MAG: ferrous iron transport protein A [Ruminococcaceae bacterium]|nr:ferrous iron transport protein A [Oscillospiraceae bacterium]
MTTLDKISTGEFAVVVAIDTQISLKQRLYDIGLMPGTKIKVVHQSPSGNPRAYLVRGAVIALRNCDAEKITVRVDGCE